MLVLFATATVAGSISVPSLRDTVDQRWPSHSHLRLLQEQPGRTSWPPSTKQEVVHRTRNSPANRLKRTPTRCDRESKRFCGPPINNTRLTNLFDKSFNY